MNHKLPAIRIGLGFDTHRIESGGSLKIGDLWIDCDLHAVGHSDADVLMHAITDAILGSICEPDIGQLFPDDRTENHDRDSADFLLEAIRRLHARKMDIVNLDCVILAEAPKMAPYIMEMRATLAKRLRIDIDQVNIKAKTGEKVDAVGRGEAISARVVALVASS